MKPNSSADILKNTFNAKTGYLTTTAITEDNQFASKAYVDSTAGTV